MNTYTVYAGQLDEVKKRLEKMRKKAETYGASFSYSVGEEYPATVSVNSIDPVSSTIYVSEKHTVPAVDIIIECDELIRANGWSVRAKIEHGDKGNIVTGFGNKPVDRAWYTAPRFLRPLQNEPLQIRHIYLRRRGGEHPAGRKELPEGLHGHQSCHRCHVGGSARHPRQRAGMDVRKNGRAGRGPGCTM